MTNQAKFTINGTPSEDPVTGDRLYQATIGEVLTLTLEVNPSPVLRATYYVYDPAAPESPLASMSAPLLTFAGSGTASDSPTNPNGTVTIAMPGAAAHSYNIRCIVATVDGQEEFVRQAAVPYTLGVQDIAKTVPEETTEYFARTWSDKFNQYLDYIALFTLVGLDDAYDKGGAGLGYFITADINPVTITVPDTSNNAGMLITQSDVTFNPNALEVSNAGTGNAIELQGAGNRQINSDENMSLRLTANSAGNHWLKIESSNAGIGDAHIDIDADEDIDIDSRSGHISLDSVDDSNFSVLGSAKHLTLAVTGGGAQILALNSAGTGLTAIDLNATAGGVTIDAATAISLDAATTSNFSVNGSGEHLTMECFGGGGQQLFLTSAGTGVDAIYMNATAGGVDIDADKSATINAKTTSNFSVTTSGEHMTVECFGGGAQRLMLSSGGTEAAAAGIGAIDISAIAGGIAMDGIKNSHYMVTGSAQSLTLEAAGGGVQSVIINSAGTSGVAIDLNATAGGIEIDAVKDSMFTVTGSAQSLGLAVVGGGAQKLTLDSAGTGTDSIDITSSVGGIELNAALNVAITNNATIGGTLGVTGLIAASGGILLAINQSMYSAGATGSILTGNHYQTVNAMSLNTGTDGNYLLICETGDYSFNFQQVQRVNPTLIIQSANQSTTEWRSSAHNQVDAFNEIGSGSMVTEYQAPTELADDASFDLPANSAGWCFLIVGDSEEYVHFVWDSSEVVDLIAQSANVVTTDTDTKFCVFDNTGKVTVRNRLGGARKVTFDLHYTTP